jgi:NarL family two-component system response regulator LiaR
MGRRSHWRSNVTSSDRIRVLIADDHAVVRHGLRTFLELQEDIEVVGEAEDGTQAIERTKELKPDVVLMDLLMPNTNGVEATLGVRKSSPATNVLVLTSFVDDESVRSVLRAGAIGYLMKDAQPGEVADPFRTVGRGDPLLHPEVVRRVIREIGGSATEDSSTPEPTVPQPSGQPVGTMTIGFSDIENSSAIIQELGDAESRPIFREHDRIVRAELAGHGGREVQHLGDGFMFAFSSARAGVTCAIEVQRAIASYVAEHPSPPLRVRIGMHTGEVIAEEFGYFGQTVWTAVRVLSNVEGGQILVSDLTRQIVGTACSCRDRGKFTLKGIPGLHRLFEVGWEAS